MGRAILYLLVAVGIGYGAWSLFLAPGEEPPELAAVAEPGPAAEPAAVPGTGAPAPAADPAEHRALLARAAEALQRAAAAGSRAEAIAAKDEARRLYWQAGLVAPDPAAEQDAAAQVDRLNEEVLFSEEPVPGKFLLYEFQANDRLWTLCQKTFPEKHGVRIEHGFLLWLNGVSDARRIREGQIFKVPLEELSLLVRKSRCRLYVLLGGVRVREYEVGIGADDKTPEGMFEIETKIEKPDWYFGGRRIPYGDPQNPLGTRWMGFRRTRKAAGYGIHGTDDPGTVGKAASEGCIRMLNGEVEELFTWVPRGTKVTIVR